MDSAEQKRETLRQRVSETTINDVTLLSTDYCNHLNEVVMMIGMVADMPEMLNEVQGWKPKSYQEHFETSGLSIGPLAIEAYDNCEAKYRNAFDRDVAAFNSRVAAGAKEVAEAIETGDAEFVVHSANTLSKQLQAIIDSLGAIIHGAADQHATPEDDTDGLSQDDIDALF